MLVVVQVAAGQQASELLQISEFMASNASTLTDEDGDSSEEERFFMFWLDR